VPVPQQGVAGHLMVSTLPPGVDAPPLTISLLFSTDSGYSWQLREYKLPK
jgi:hypothetical protein